MMGLNLTFKLKMSFEKSSELGLMKWSKISWKSVGVALDAYSRRFSLSKAH